MEPPRYAPRICPKIRIIVGHEVARAGAAAAVLDDDAEGDLSVLCRAVGDHHGVGVVLAGAADDDMPCD